MTIGTQSIAVDWFLWIVTEDVVQKNPVSENDSAAQILPIPLQFLQRCWSERRNPAAVHQFHNRWPV